MTQQTNEYLLEQIGKLYGRNQGLQRGHATLTRRVQELEAKLKEAQAQLLKNSNTPFAVAGGEVYIQSALIGEKTMCRCTPTPVITAADTQLQADIEALTERVADLEFATYPESVRRRALTENEGRRAEEFRQAVAYLVRQGIEKALKPGGALYDFCRR